LFSGASIAEVHVGELKDPNDAPFKKIVLKVQYPGMEKIFEADMSSFSFFVQIARPEQSSTSQEMMRHIRNEFDFKNEARMQKIIRENMLKYYKEEEFAIPRIVDKYVSRGAIVMERMYGQKILEYLADNPDKTHRMTERIIRVYGHQIFLDGIFHGDPHPGNMFITENDGIVLLDFGQVKVFNNELRHAVCKLIIALAEQNEEKLLQEIKALGIHTKKDDPYNLKTMTTIYFDTLPIQESIPDFFDRLATEDPPVVPSELTFIMRVNVILRGLLSIVDINDLSTAKIWSEYAKRGLNIKHKVIIPQTLS